jgi:cytoskeletal protein RodZ
VLAEGRIASRVAPHMKQDTQIGLGRALRTARLRCGKSLEEAGRELRVRTDYLDALEREDFGALGGDVYVRSFMRSYARFLGLNAEKAVAYYERAYGRPRPEPAPVERSPVVAPTEALQLTEKRRPNWLLAAAATVIVLAAAAALGVLSTDSPVPPPAAPTETPLTGDAARVTQVDVVAVGEVEVTAVLDGEKTERVTLDAGEARSWQAQRRIDLEVSDGILVELTVNGQDLGAPGQANQQFTASYFPTSYRTEPSTETAAP